MMLGTSPDVGGGRQIGRVPCGGGRLELRLGLVRLPVDLVQVGVAQCWHTSVRLPHSARPANVT
jgi:hypothetical protein